MKPEKFLFVSDLHGKQSRYDKLFQYLNENVVDAVFIGGDILPNFLRGKTEPDSFFRMLTMKIESLKKNTGNLPNFFVIMGNDDPRMFEENLINVYDNNYWHYIQQKVVNHGKYTIFGYSFVPPTPFRLKDWEKFDVSRFVDPGCFEPTEGIHTVDFDAEKLEWETIEKDLQQLTKDCPNENLIGLFHSPPYKTKLDRAALDGVMIDHIPADVHVGSIAIMNFINERQPLITLHGHIHESSRITGYWKEVFNSTVSFNASYDGEELSIICFDPANPDVSSRILL